MDPNYQQPGQQIPPRPQNPYGFIMEAPRKPKRSLLPKGSSLMSRVLIAVGGLIVLLIAFSVFTSILSSGSKGNTQALTNLVAEQQEIVRITELSVLGATDPGTVAYAQTAKLTVQSQQVKLIGYLTRNKVKLTPKLLAANKNTKADDALTAAKAANRFDAVAKDMLVTSLTNYASNLKTSYDNSNNNTTKQLLSSSYESVQVLLK